MQCVLISVRNEVHPRLQRIVRGAESDRALFSVVGDREALEDDAVSVLTEPQPKARDVRGGLVLEGPRFERDLESSAVRFDAVPEAPSEPGQEGRRGCGDFSVRHQGARWSGAGMNPRNRCRVACVQDKAFVRYAVERHVRSPWYEKIQHRLDRKAFDAQVEDVIREWGGLLDTDAAAMVVVERLGGQVASFARIADLEEGMEANLRATVTAITPVRTFTRQDGAGGRVVNLELRDESGFCRFALWDDDVGLVERGKITVGATVRALDCYVKRTNFGLDVGRGKFGALVVEGA
jgi:hypothetical protein